MYNCNNKTNFRFNVAMATSVSLCVDTFTKRFDVCNVQLHVLTIITATTRTAMPIR